MSLIRRASWRMASTSFGSSIKSTVVVLLIIIVRFRTGKTETVSDISPPDMSHHPIYSKYEFGKTDNIIDIGIQPLEIPPGVISETMQRDTVLRDALSELGLKARFHPFLKGADINFFLRRGDMEVVFAGDMPTVTASTTLDVVVVTLTKMGFNSIVARDHMLLENLRGKRIAYAFDVFLIDVADQDDELIATKPGNDIILAHIAEQLGRHMLQQLIAGSVPVHVVDIFELIQVYE